jgi:iron complex outermembrane receptor protein/hemoglobin/transferrin/lactoferrin receptor protein
MRGTGFLFMVVLWAGLSPGDADRAWAQQPPPPEEAGEAGEAGEEEGQAPAAETPGQVSTTRARVAMSPVRRTTVVTREDIAMRLPRSAPDALRYEPGVFVQQTAQSQASPFVRGRTGQQTLMLFDGIRLNHSLFRQGPNQYFFTVDTRTIDRIEVLRGGGSTRFGADAISGVIGVSPIEPMLLPGEAGLALRPTGMVRVGSADGEWGGRAQLDGQWGPTLGWVGGFGTRTVGALRTGGPVRNPADGGIPEVPRFEEDGRTMVGTGFDEYTWDLRTVWAPTPRRRVTAAVYDYRQRNAPRTDLCPPPFAPASDCLVYDAQDRLLLMTAWEETPRQAGLERSRVTLSLQRMHERRSLDRPALRTENIGRDDLWTGGVHWQAQSRALPLGAAVAARVRWGADGWHDTVASRAWIRFTDVDVTRRRSRGQYLDGGRYTQLGAFSEVDLFLWQRLTLHGGARASHVRASAPGDALSGTLAVDQTWTRAVGHAGATVHATEALRFTFSADQGFRAPNLDDLTSRQQTGPGFQIENSMLRPESAWTTEVGMHVLTPVWQSDLWAWRTSLQNLMLRAPREASACPPDTAQCNASWSRFQLVNAPEFSEIVGVEGGLTARPIPRLEVRASLAWAEGTGPNPLPRPADRAVPWDPRQPLSRIPPWNGTLEVMWRQDPRWYVGSALRWAALQDQLAASDRADARIPIGGTPGFAVVDLRAGWRPRTWLRMHAVLENLMDSGYRYHGSSVLGAGRSVMVQADVGW